MKSFIATLALVAGANARIAERWDSCSFHVSSSGAVTGTVGQLDDGQNRVGGPLSPAQYFIKDGAITDTNGRGCILTGVLSRSLPAAHPSKLQMLTISRVHDPMAV
jgi:hypothetical protein